jgi:outer membrane protein assembly factor BamB
VIALEQPTGKQNWQVTLPTNIASMQVTFNGVYAINTPNNVLYGLDRTTGQQVGNFKANQIHAYFVGT